MHAAAARFCLVVMCAAPLGVVAGCGGGGLEAVRARAATEFSCPPGDVKVQDLGGSSFKVDACGTIATYACLAGNPFESMCTREGAAMSPLAVSGLPDKPSAGVVARALEVVLPEARVCLGTEAPSAQASVTFSSAGTVAAVAVSGVDPSKAAAACIRGALMKATVPPFVQIAYATSVTITPN